MKSKVSWLLLTLPALFSARTAPACGISTHVEVSHRSACWFDAGEYPDYQAMIEAYPEALQGGASFPDWGYAVDGYGDAGEEAHWDPFLQQAADYVYRTYPPPWDEDTARLAVFLFATSAHSIADIRWHGLGAAEGFIDMLAAQDFAGDWGAAHTAADTGGDMVVALELDQSYMTSPWYVPVADMVNVYHELGYDYVGADAIIFGNFLLFLGGHAEKAVGQLLYPPFAKNSPMLVEQLQDYFVGGIDDMSIQSAWKWLEMIDWMENGVAGSSRAIVPDHFAAGEGHGPLEAVELGLKLLDEGTIQVRVEKTARGVMFYAEPGPGAREAAPARPSQYLERLPPTAREMLGFSKTRTHDGPRPMARTTAGEVVLTHDLPYAHAGTALAAVDLTGDGRTELLVGVPGEGGAGAPQRGAVYLLQGVNDLSAWAGPLAAAAAQVLQGTEDYGRFGWSLATPDLNADGLPDLAVGAPTTGSRALEYSGAVHIFINHGGTFDASPQLTISCDDTYCGFGHVLKAVDFNQDGFLDLAVGSPFAREGGTQRGQVTLFAAGSEWNQRTGEVDSGLADVTLSGTQDYEWFGSALDVQEFDSRGPLLLVGSPTFNAGELPSSGRISAFELSSSGPVSVFTLLGSAAFDQLGADFVTGAFIDPGVALLALSLPSSSVGGTYAGKAVVTSISGLSGEVSLDALTPVAELEGSQTFGRFAFGIDASDLNRDGISELITLSPWDSTPGGPENGSVGIWEGGLPGGITRAAQDRAPRLLEGQVLAARFGSQVVVGDFNADGQLELVVASRQDSTLAPLAGSLSIVPAEGGSARSGVRSSRSMKSSSNRARTRDAR